MKKRISSIIMCLTMLIMNAISATGITASANETEQQNAPSDTYVSDGGRTITNPRIVKDDSMQAGQKVTWDCIWFGSYPQSEITSSDAMYNTLQNAAGWDSNGDISLEGNKYRRIKKSDATYATSGDSSYYDWSDADAWHYFIYEPIKWRVLKIEGNRALLLSDIALDDQEYNLAKGEITWETSTMRSWLNGYESSSNKKGIDYSGKNFINSAFTSREREEITDTAVINSNNIDYGTAGGNNTIDKVFFLSEAEVYGDDAATHGFVSSHGTYDEARRLKSSDYAKAMGGYTNRGKYEGNCWWWLRSPGRYSYLAARVSYCGDVYCSHYATGLYVGVRAALNLNLSSNVWKDAGTVGSKEGETFFWVTYNANGGSGAPESHIKNAGTPVSLSGTIPVRLGYTFSGWSENSTAVAVDYKPGDEYKENNNAVLYAVWKKDEPENKIQIKYDANGGSGAPEPQTKQPAIELTLSDQKPTHPGYTFLGWSIDRNAESAAYEAGGTYTDDTSITLYAVWKINTYTVTYDANGGTGAPSAQIKTYGQPLILSSKVPVRSGYTFLGWSESNTATDAAYQAGGEYIENSNAVLYAIWEKDKSENKVQVTYDANGGSNAPEPQTKEPDAVLILSDQKPIRSGYTFLGWSTDRNAESAVYEAGGEYTGNKDIILYAIWKQNEPSVNPPSDPGTSKDDPSGSTTDKTTGNNGTVKTKKKQKITTSASVYTKAYGSKAFSLGASASGGAKLTYKSANTKIAKVSGSGKVTVKKYGVVKITIMAGATKDYESAKKTVTIKVVPKAVTLKTVKSPSQRRIEISWKKNKDVSGYNLYLSKRKDFKKWTVERSLKKNKTSWSAANCKSKTTYYVKIRAYKKIGKTKYYGEWSKVKKVKTK